MKGQKDTVKCNHGFLVFIAITNNSNDNHMEQIGNENGTENYPSSLPPRNIPFKSSELHTIIMVYG